jgi:hypothetical protein
MTVTTYPSPLHGLLLEELPEVLAAEVLTQLGPTDLTVLMRVGPASRAEVMASGLPRTGAWRSSSRSYAGPSSGWLKPRRMNASLWVARVCTRR